MYNEDCYCPQINAKQAELSNPELQNIVSRAYLNLGRAVVGGDGPSIIYDNGKLLLNRGTYLLSYSTSAVWTTTPYGTNEAIIGVVYNGNELLDSVCRGQIPPQTTNVGLVPFKLNLSKSIIINVTHSHSTIQLINKSEKIMGFQDTTLTLVKLG